MENIETVYPTSPMQRGLLAASLSTAEADPYLRQQTCELEGELDPGVLHAAWEAVIRRHAALRTHFLWERLREPVQVVLRAAVLPWVEEDWRGLSAVEREERWAEILREDLSRALPLDAAPLLRWRLVRMEDRRWRLLWTYHHAVLDGWSVQIVLRDLTAWYRGLRGGGPVDLPAAGAFRDYLAWLARRDASAAEAFWRERMEGVEPALLAGLAGEGGAPAEEMAQAPGLAAALQGLARELRVTPSTVVEAAWGIVLAAATGLDDVAFGCVVSGRPPSLPRVLDTVGVLSNLLPARLRVRRRETAGELLARFQREQVEARDVDWVFLGDVQRWSGLPAGAPLFDSVLAYQSYPRFSGEAGGEGAGGLSLTGLSGAERTSYPLALNAWPGEVGTLSVRAMADPSRMAAGTVRRLLRQWVSVIRQMAEGPGRRVGDLALLDEAEARQVVVEWNRAVRWPVESCLHELFAERARRHPERVAVVCAGEPVTYGGLERRAAALAGRLRRLGVGPEARVGLCLERGVELVVGVLGVLKAGGAYVPLDPDSPPERSAWILEDSGAEVVVTVPALRERLGGWAGPVVCLGQEEETSEPVEAGVSPENAAYVIYTSGSTGRPKGVLVTHANVARLFRATEEPLALSEHDVWTLFHSYAFDFSVWELWGALLYGGKLVIVPYWQSRSPEAMWELLEREGVTVLSQTPSAFSQLLAAEPEGGGGESLRLVVFGGETLEPGMLAGRARRHPRTRLVNMYGITETTVHVTLRELSREDMEERGGVSAIGERLSDLQTYVLDREMAPVAVGVPGELFVGGAGLARGYVGRPELTAERFVPHPFPAEPGERLYRSGDLGRWREGGGLEHLGRVDDQVKIRGHRIELGEVRVALESHPGVSQAAVVVREDRAGQKRLAAYVVPRGAVTVEELRSHLASRLPAPMVPSAWKLLASLPLTRNGKLDRRTLPAPEEPGGGTGFRPPGTATAELLAGIWSEVLGCGPVGADANFFALGGDSMLAVQVCARARKAGLPLAVEDLFRTPTLDELASQVESARQPSLAEAAGLPRFGLVQEADRGRLPEEIEDAYPMSRLQLGMLFHGEYAPEAPVYHDVHSFHLRTALREDALRSALAGLMARHAVLRTAFDLASYSQPLQLVHPRVDPPLETADLRHLGLAEQERAVAELIAAEKSRRFDWARPPLFRFHLARRAEDRFQLTFTHHHAILDGWSVATLLTGLVRAWTAGGELPGEDLPGAPFRSYVAAELALLEPGPAARYWEEKLADPPPEVSWLTARGGRQREISVADLAVPSPTAARLAALARELGVPLKSVLLAAHLRVLERIGGQREVVTGLVVNGRPEEDGGAAALGLFLNAVPFRLALPHGTWRETVSRAFAAERELMPYRSYPVASMQKLAGRVRLFDTGFNFVHFHVYRTLAGEGSIEVLAASSFEQADTTLAAVFVQDPFTAALRLHLQHDLDVLGREEAEALAGLYACTLQALADRPDEPVQPRDFVTPGQWSALLGGAGERRELPGPASLPEILAEHARRDPAGTAMIHGGESLSYGELYRRALRLARRLDRLGVGPEVRVAVCLERGLDLMVAVFGVLLAGGVYVPLDPDAVGERTALMVEDCRPTVLLTSGALVASAPRGSATVALLHGEDGLAAEPLPGPVPVDPGNAAYVIYTSGSTGRPKGAVIGHGALRNTALAQAELFGFGPGTRVLQLVTVAFDAAVSDWATTLAAGGTLVLAPHRALQSLQEIEDLLIRHEIHSVAMPPGILARLPPERFPHLRTVVVGGDSPPAGLAARWGGGGRRLLNAYGPTEATITVSAAEMVAGVSSIGRPLANVHAYVLDGEMGLLPAGLPGELWVGGEGLARGYLGRPDLTAERFPPHPFAGELGRGGERLYRTGDRARWRTDGALELLGRVDEQVKIRGVRVEPGEVRAVLEGHLEVEAAAVVAREDRPGERRLVAYVVGRRGPAALDLEDVQRHARGRLSAPMVPSAWVILEALPRTPHGKLDRKALPAPWEADGHPREHHQPPRTPMEELLAGIWSEVLGRGPVGVEDNFFALGGDSLTATQAVTRARARLGILVELRAIFESLTLGEFAAAVEGSLGTREARPPLRRREPSLLAPLSYAQQRLWLVDRLQPGNGAYHIAMALRLQGPLDPAALGRSLDEVVRRHEALRTRLVEIDGAVMQRIGEPPSGLLEVVDLRGGGPAEREAGLLARARRQAERPFDLARDLPVRAELLQLGEAEHALLITLHHVASDGWSMGLLIREVTALYQSFAGGLAAPLPEPPVQYADYAVWQREWLAGEALERELDYWRGELRDLPQMELPLDRPRPAVASHRGGRERVCWGPELAGAVTALCRRRGATRFMALLAAWAVVLERWTGQPEAVIGADVANRSLPELEGLIGFFVNQLVLRAAVRREESFLELLDRVRETALAAYRHQDAPFEQVVEAVAPERDLGRSPLFQVKLVLQNLPTAAATAGDLVVSPIEPVVTAAVYDLLLSLDDRDGEEIAGSLIYGTDLFERATVRRMLGHLERVLAQAAERPERHLRDLDLLDEAERRQVLVEWSGGESPRPDRCLHELFAERAGRSPIAPAVVSRSGEVSYGELEEWANRLARYLIRLGVGAETRVALCVERGVDLVVAILATLKAGGAYVPLDAELPAERLAWLLEDSEAAVLLTQESLLDRLPVTWIPVICLDRESGEIALEPADAAMGGAFPGNAAYVIYTSGSTGRPKGVVVEHGSAVNLALSQIEAFGIGPESRVLQFAPAVFDASVSEWATALLSGAALAVGSKGELLPGGALEEAVERLGVTVATLPPSVLARVRPGALAGVRTLVSAGEACGGPLAERWRQGRRMLNAYGPTEVTVCASMGELTGGTVSIGQPIANGRVYVLDGELEPVPVGMAGELWVGGVGVARGYAGRPELTAERFVPDPFSGAPGARLYRTGDRGRWRATGELEFLGRADGQVKIRGHRIEPGEVEAALLEHPGVRQAVVVAREDRAGETRLVAYLVGAVDAEEVRRHLRERLPEVMVPAAVVALETLPLTVSGKLDRRALPAPEEVAGEARERRAPRTAVEELLAGVWAEVLGGEVGLDDDFFALGGHSLLAAQVVSRVRELLGVELELRRLFERRTLEAVAGEVEELRRGGAPPPVRIERRTGSGPAPLSYAQQRLWFLDQLQPGSRAFHLPAAVRLRGRLDVGALARGLAEVVRRHEVLRTRFVEEGGAVAQRIEAPRSGRLAVLDLSDLTDAEREAEVAARVREQMDLPFDLSRGPLLRTALLRLEEREHVLLITLHHIASDGWSMGAMVRELAALYEAFARGEESPLPELPVQYADYAVWQRERLAGGEMDRQLAYWRERLRDLPALELPADRPRPAALSARGAGEPVRLGGGLGHRLRGLCRREGVTLFMALLAAWEVVLWRWSGQRDFAVGTPVANRGRVEIEGLIGFFLNTLALRAEVDGGESFQALLERVRETAFAAYAHQDVPFERVVEAVAPERTLSRTPLFQAMLTFQNVPRAEVRLPDLTLGEVALEQRTAQFELSLVLGETAGDPELGIAGTVVYATDLYEAATARRMIAQLGRVLEQGTERPGLRLAELELLSGAERRQVLVEWNQTGRPWPDLRCVDELLAERAAERPEALAVMNGGERLTYGEVSRRVDGLARRLLAAGAGDGPGFVPVCVASGRDALIAFWAVLRCNRAFVPIDPLWPRERRERALARLGSRVAVVDPGLDLTGVETLPVEAPLPAEGGEIERRPDLDAPIYAIFTSGSTGEPKAAVAAHRGIANRLLWMNEEIGPEAAAVVVQTTPHTFDSAVWQLFWPLLNGGVVVVPEPGRAADRGYLFDLIRQHGCTLIDLVPSILRSLLRGEGAEASLATLRCVIVGGEECTWGLVRDLRAAAPAARILNLYGPTEASIGCVWCDLTDRREEAGRVPIGRPIANCRAYVLDEAGTRPVPAGALGELYLGGVCVGGGYLGVPELTREAFVERSLDGAPERLYRTGDRARWLPGGLLELLGRTDEQVKVRGYRVELGEVRAALEGIPGVAQAAVVVREDRPGERRLVAYVTGQDGPLDVEGLRRAARERLPSPMVPAAWVVLETLPVTAGGKLDRRALPAPDDGFSGGEEPREPRGAVEARLLGIWREVLGRERIGVEDNFFALGGDSILSIQVVARARRAGIGITSRQMFEHQTVAELAAVATAAATLAEQGAITGDVPLTPIQSRFFARNPEGPSHFNQAVVLRLRESVDGAALRKAAGAVLAHHDALRARFTPTGDSGWRQSLAPVEGAGGETAEIDLSSIPDTRLSACLEAAAAQAQGSLDVRTGPLLRVALFRCGAGRSDRLLIAVHHLAVDAVSWRFLLEDLHASLQAEGLPAKTSSFKTWAERLAAHAAGSDLEGEIGHWRRTLAGVAPLPRELAGLNTFGAASRWTTSLDERATQALLGRVGDAGAEIHLRILAALAEALGDWTGDETVVVDVEGHGREDLFDGIDVSRTAGWFTSLYPVRLDLPRAPLSERLESATAQARETPSRGFGYGLLRYLRGAEGLRDTPEPEVCLNHLGHTGRLGGGLGFFELADESPGPQQGAGVLRAHLLDVETWIAGGRLHARWTYSRRAHRPETLQRLGEVFLRALETMAWDDRTGPPSDLQEFQDFPLVEMDVETLERIAEIARQAEEG